MLRGLSSRRAGGPERFFREFDGELAASLGLPLLSPPSREWAEETYEIARIISSEWWDDGVWDFEVERE